MKKMNKLLLVALVLGAAYLIYSVVYWSGVGGTADSSAEAAGAALASALVMPHLLATLLAVVFNALGLFMNKRGFALTGGILYAVAMLLFPAYFFFVVVQAILSFVAFAQMRKGVASEK